ncbi:MAG: glycosyltransferase family 4 protein [Candidatus Krumholzibacteria bacterium]|nr:glycosyltransferase family 4 protein [Candidatus Krumholzibacteria bacterium]MDP7021783.1 glycosyltransferase family 4 protein [Candidatus Krumholzibacteria bacterium]
MKIGMLSEFYYPQPGGISEHLRALSRQLRLRGHEVQILTSNIRGNVVERDPGIRRLGRSLAVPYNGSLSRISLGWRLSRHFDRLLEEEQFDLVHIHNPYMPTLPLLALSRAKCPLVGTFHSNFSMDPLIWLFQRPLRRLLARQKAGIAVSEAARLAAEPLCPGEHPIIPNGVDFSFFEEIARQGGDSFSGLDSSKKKILFVGATVRRKGLPYLLKAFERLRQDRDDLELIVVGDGPDRRRIQRKIPQQLRDDIHFVGFVPRGKLAEYYASADIFCAPSLGQESFGMVLLEAMAAGLPVVGFDIEGYRDVVSHERDGLLVPPRDELALAEALDRLLATPEECIRFGRAGQLKAESMDWSRIAERVESVYYEVLGLSLHQEELPFESRAKSVGSS